MAGAALSRPGDASPTSRNCANSCCACPSREYPERPGAETKGYDGSSANEACVAYPLTRAREQKRETAPEGSPLWLSAAARGWP